MKNETVDLTVDETSLPDHQVPDQIEEIESLTNAEPASKQFPDDQPSDEVKSLKSEMELLKQRIAELEQENIQLFRRESDLKSKYIQLLEKHQQ